MCIPGVVLCLQGVPLCIPGGFRTLLYLPGGSTVYTRGFYCVYQEALLRMPWGTTVYTRRLYCIYQGVGPARGCQAKESDTVNYTVHKIYRNQEEKPCFQQLLWYAVVTYIYLVLWSDFVLRLILKVIFRDTSLAHLLLHLVPGARCQVPGATKSGQVRYSWKELSKCSLMVQTRGLYDIPVKSYSS